VIDIEEPKGKTLEAVADFTGRVKKEDGEAQEQLAETRGNGKAVLTGHSPTGGQGVMLSARAIAIWELGPSGGQDRHDTNDQNKLHERDWLSGQARDWASGHSRGWASGHSRGWASGHAEDSP